MSEKQLLGTSAVSNSVLTILPFPDKFILSRAITLSDGDGYTFFQKSFLSNMSNNKRHWLQVPAIKLLGY